MLKTGSADECGLKTEQLSSLTSSGGVPSCAWDLSGLYLFLYNRSDCFFPSIYIQSVSYRATSSDDLPEEVLTFYKKTQIH